MRVDPNAALKSSAPSVAAASLRATLLACRHPDRAVHGASRGRGPCLGKPLEADRLKISAIAPIISSLRGSIFLKTRTPAPLRALNSQTTCNLN